MNAVRWNVEETPRTNCNGALCISGIIKMNPSCDNFAVNVMLAMMTPSGCSLEASQ